VQRYGEGVSSEAVVEILGPLRSRGETVYGGEAVSVAEHSLQAAALASANGSSDALVAACLLHDVGWLLGAEPGSHEEVGAELLDRYLPAEVVEPVRLHVAAKRYLCAIDPTYYDTLSPASRRTLVAQGGPFDQSERRDFEASPFAAAALSLRRFDDQAKVFGATTAPLETYEGLIRDLIADSFALPGD